MSERSVGECESHTQSLTFDQNLNPEQKSSRLTPNEYAPSFPMESDEKVAPDITAYFSNQESPSTFDLITATQAVKLDDNAPGNVSASIHTPMSISTLETSDDALATDRLFLSSDAFIFDDDQCHAWIPGERTKLYLSALKSVSDPTESPEEDRVTTPRILMVENLGDPLLEVVERILGAEDVGRKVA